MANITIRDLAHDQVEPDPRNPRQVFDEAALTELANDIAVRGIMQPLVVRPHPEAKGHFMIVFGERRWRAAELVELATVPAIVRDMSDLDVLEAQIAENGKRADVHPLEEADAYRRLHEEHGRDVDEIAELCGKSRATIYAAMKLCELAPEPRRAFLAGKFDKSVALLIARLPAKDQAKACEVILTEGDWLDEGGRGVMSFREAKQYIRDTFMLQLARAPFAVDDTTLVAKAGPCTTCPKRTGNQRELFADVVEDKGGADVCTDPACYKAKLDVHWSRLAASAKEKGREVLEGKQAQGAGGYGDKKYVDLDAHATDIGEYNKTYRQLLGKHAEDIVAAVARDDHGGIKALASREEIKKQLKDAGVKPRAGTPATKSEDDWRKEQEERNKLERIVTEAATNAVMAKLYDAEPMKHARLLARMAVRVCRNDAHRAVMKARELAASKDYTPRVTLLAYVGELKTLDEVRNLTFELLLAETRGWLDEAARGIGGAEDDDPLERMDVMSNLEDAAQVLGVEVQAIVEKAKKELAELKATKKKAKPSARAEEAAS